ncbi:C4-dicarboxylate TRAP transporter substrate-binding protein [Tepidamorphus sp. 3E244]|uniref:C4-dicarboxylate TRAP transporter substrate-binding protein n=1 Tax=Tepidamorphus sp. 3E244 TaxID=3385498 RepID=UPI0038FC8975
MEKFTLSAACVAAALLGSTALSSAETINLRMGSGHPIGLLAYTETAHNWFAPELKKRIEERTDHTVNIQELHAGQVAKVTEVLEATRDGLLDIGFISLIFEPSNGFIQNFTLFLPFNSPDAVKVTEAVLATYDEFPELYEVFETEHNQKWLGGACLANYGLGTNFAWSEFKELEGHKIAGAGINLDWIAGATPVASNLNEAYQSIQSGVYEGYLSASPWWSAFKLNEVAPHYTKTDFGAQFFNAVTINMGTWEKLPEDVKEILVEMGKEWSGVTAEVCARNDAEGLEKLRALNVEVKEISDTAKKDWAEALKDFPDRMAKDADSRGLPGTKVLQFYMNKIEEMGHEWPYRYEIK